MTILVTCTTTQRKQGTTKVQHFDTLMAARAAVMAVSDRHLTNAEVKEWRQNAGK